MKNRFFDIALDHASRLVGQPARLLKLVTQSLFLVDRTHLSGKRWKERALLMGRLVSAYARGRYTAISFRALVAMVAALIYFVNPFDLVPDALLGIGFADDLTILTWVFGLWEQELKLFEQWEHNAQSGTINQSTA
jgi:uncharacterized membrane protein YkvA (DUF1232 family)